MSVNKVILLGNVCGDPSVRMVEKRTVAEFSIATTERGYKNSAGVTIPERTEFHRIVMWDRNAEMAERYVRKGSKLYVEGKIRSRVWEDRNALKHNITEIYADYFEIVGRQG